METYGFQRFLRQSHLAQRRYCHGKPGPLHYPGIVLPGAYAGGHASEAHRIEACPPTQEGKVIYTAKDKKTNKVFPALEWMAAMCSHIPNKGEQMVRYYGFYSNVTRGKRKAAGTDDALPCILEPQDDGKALRRDWARLIQKIYETDPLVCPKCKGPTRIISFIEKGEVVREILKHLGIWLVRSRPPPKIHAPPTLSESESADHRPQHQDTYIYPDPDYSWDEYILS